MEQLQQIVLGDVSQIIIEIELIEINVFSVQRHTDTIVSHDLHLKMLVESHVHEEIMWQ